ncbi:unnamed protein product [Blepharisma stoltei]|uniref:RING-type E3 ubiquitin transferase n=1 Tax=Blepharisma stoltei TaxID=1481888 RepID=A0AAU9J7C1_9CILI|nr:unnamed protein product [Blepharisma stoltei]
MLIILLIIICVSRKTRSRRLRYYSHTYAHSQRTEPLLASRYELHIVSELNTSRTESLNLDDECAICKQLYRPNEIVARTDRCFHLFHSSCYTNWMRYNSTCPICRK